MEYLSTKDHTMEHTWDEMRTSACKSLSVTPPLHQHEGYTAILGSLLSILSRLQNDEQHTLHLQSPEDHLRYHYSRSSINPHST